METSPAISVLFPVHDSAPYVEEAIQSVLDQSFANFELLLLTEKLDTETRGRINRFDDDRIERVDVDGGTIVSALNAGLEEATGEFVSRMDADDVCYPERFERQVAFLEKHTRVGVVGSAFRKIDPDGNPCGVTTVQSSDVEIRWTMLLSSCIPHPTAMIRRSILEEHDIRYRSEFEAAEDYDIWRRLLSHTRAANLATPLLKYRVGHEQKKSNREAKRQCHNGNVVAYQTIREQFSSVNISREEVSELRRLIHGSGNERIQKRVLGERYVALLNAFTSRYEERENIASVCSLAALRLARGLARPPIELGSLRLVPRLLKLDPKVPLELLQHVSKNPNVITDRI